MDDYQDQAKWYRVMVENTIDGSEEYWGDYDTRPQAVQAVADFIAMNGTVQYSITRTRGQEGGN